MFYTRWFSGYDDLEDAYAIRRAVFIDEQGVDPAAELVPEEDRTALHLVVYEEDAGASAAVATGRLICGGGEALIGRVAVLREARGRGYGDLVMRILIRKAYDLGADNQQVHAQLTARGFYEVLGFAPKGETYEEAGIPHINMEHKGDIAGACGEKPRGKV